MAGKKRQLEETSGNAIKLKRHKVLDAPEKPQANSSILQPEEVDFPRGGGTTLTPIEYKAVRAEAFKEIGDEVIFKGESRGGESHKKDKKTKISQGRSKKVSISKASTGNKRIEHLSYKRIAIGMKVLCQIIAIYPFHLVVSLPNQLVGHIPITNISTQLTSILDSAERNDDDDEIEMNDANQSPDLTEFFNSGKYVRAVVTAVKPHGTTERRTFNHARDGMEVASWRIELSLVPEQVNSGLIKADLHRGFTLVASVRSVEDHGYILDFGMPDISGFLRYKKEKGKSEDARMAIGSLIDVVVDKLTEDGRTCVFTSEENTFRSILQKDISNASSLLPGLLVPALITSIVPSGLVLQVLSSFGGTIDICHLAQGTRPSDFKEGQKVRARILYDVTGTTPPQFALSLNEHLISLEPKKRKTEENQSLIDAFPVGTILQSVKVTRVEPERGLQVSIEEGVDGFVHISHVSDDHVPSLSSNSGLWKVDSIHRARVLGYHSLDGILQLSMRDSVLDQKFLNVSEVHAGEVLKGTIKKLTDSALFVSISGNVDAMVWPNHYADILLKHPQRRFKLGSTVKCRVLAVDPELKRILLTAKKTLVESELPIIASMKDVEPGMVTHGTICKVLDKCLIVEFYNHQRAVVPAREASETPLNSLTDSFAIGKPVKVRILSVDRETSRMVASIRQVIEGLKSEVDVTAVEVGQSVSGSITEIHRANVLLILEPSKVRALISLHNVANHYSSTVDELRSSLKSGDKMDGLVVVSRNPDKGIVIVANHPGVKPSKHLMTEVKDVSEGSRIVGRVLKYGRHGTLLKVSGRWTASLHPTDTCDDYNKGTPFPSINSMVEGVVIEVDRTKRHCILSTRPSRVEYDFKGNIIDKEIGNWEDVKIGCNVRGFIKSISAHGLFVTLSRVIDARVQIKELYDGYVKDWKSGFEVNQLVSGRILSIDIEKKQVELSFRTGSTKRAESSFGDLVEGQKIEGQVKKVEDYGVFIIINGTKLTGLCHKSEISDNKDSDVGIALRNFKEGDAVEAVILSLDSSKRRISLGLKPSYFSSVEVEMTSEDGEMPGQDVESPIPVRMEIDSEGAGQEKNEGSEDESEDDIQFLYTPSQDVENPAKKISQEAAPLVPVLTLKGGFQWTEEDAAIGAGDEDLSDSEDEEEENAEKTKRKKKKIEQDLTASMHTQTPQSVADFERNLLSSPNSSFLWIQYMAFHLQLADIEKAREIGKRALQTISIREEHEKLNVWVALLNLENTYGTDESLEGLFKDAARRNDAKTVYLRLAAIFDQSEKFEKAEEQYRRTCKKFGQSSKVWVLFSEHYLRRSLAEDARKLLPRSLQSLEKRKHLKTISKFAQLEYKLGDPERGKTIFEGIIDSHPKRWDLWSIYIDMEAGQKDIQSCRNLFDRILAFKMTSHKAKSFFKKWLETERRIGDEDGQRTVKEKAIDWTQRLASAS